MANRLISAFGIALTSAILATWAYGMSSGQVEATLAYAVIMTLAYAGAVRWWGSRVNVAAVAFAVTLPVILISVRFLGHDQRHWDTAAVVGAALAAGVAFVLRSRSGPAAMDREDSPA